MALDLKICSLCGHHDVSHNTFHGCMGAGWAENNLFQKKVACDCPGFLIINEVPIFK